MKITLIAFFACGILISAKAQTADPNKKYAPQQLQADLLFVKQQLFNAHADPFSEINKVAYEQVFDQISKQLTDSMTATAFYKTIKPAMAPLSDEHAQISIAANLQTDAYKNGNIFLPFSLTRKGNLYVIDELLAENTGLKSGEAITHINGEAIAILVGRCANYSVGFPGQRASNALKQFGYLYTQSQPGIHNSFEVSTASDKVIILKGTAFKDWQNYVLRKAGQTGKQDSRITYARFGNAGYINARAFDAHSDKDVDSIDRQIAGIFKQIKADGITRLFIDVSKNSGGNSAVGDAMINFFYSKPYRGYQCNWRRSDEYLNLLKSWGSTEDLYAAQPAGKVIHFNSSDNIPPKDVPDRFNGKVYVVIGPGTFSSAIMFATTIKDNHIATLIGQIPPNGHPNHFGELYATKLPNTRLDLRFGVKEWIRPAGKTGENVLRPDIIIDTDQLPEAIVKSVK